MDADVIVVGAGLAGLVCAAELHAAGKRVILLDQESQANLGGQAWWSFGGLFLVGSPMQRRLGVHDSVDLAWSDWRTSAGWDRLDGDLAEDRWGREWARAYVDFAAGEKLAWLLEKGVTFTPLVGWAERGSGSSSAHGNSVPRFHIAWGTGTGVVRPFADTVRQAAADGTLDLRFRHRVDELVTGAGAVVGVRGSILESDGAPRGVASSRVPIGDFDLRAQAVVVASGGIGGDHELVRAWWPERLGTPPASMVSGVPAYVDGRMLGIAESSGARVVNRDRMWHYVEGIRNWDPIWPEHGIRILPGPSSLWLDALGRRLPAPYLPGFDTLGTLAHLRTTPDLARFDHSWFVLTQRIIEKEFALSGSEQNPDITGHDLRLLARTRIAKGAPPPVEAFKQHGADFVVAEDVRGLVAGMNALTDEPLLDARRIEAIMHERDLQLRNRFTKDAQLMAVRNARRYLGDRITRVASPHRLLDPAAGPLIAVKLHVLTRKSLGGLQTDLSARALGADGHPVPGLYAVGESAGFGGGGLHGYNSLEGTFLGGCLFTGRTAGRALAAAL